jgi:hypothetical protein
MDIMRQPPPYFPQNQLSPPDENRYKKLKLIFALVIVVLIGVLAAAGYGLYWLINYLMS